VRVPQIVHVILERRRCARQLVHSGPAADRDATRLISPQLRHAARSAPSMTAHESHIGRGPEARRHGRSRPHLEQIATGDW
jgi:hypothetical protein